MARYTAEQIDQLVKDFHRDGFCMLRGHFSTSLLEEWREQFRPLLDTHIEREGHLKNRGAQR
jgi:hypothetical protein